MGGPTVLNIAGTCKPVALRYTASVVETTTTGFGDLTHVSAQPRRAAFLCVLPSRASTINGRAWVGRPSGLPGAYVTGSPTLPCARSPHLAMGSGLTTHVRGRTMSIQIPARPEQTQSPLEIIRTALRDASTAPTVCDALDVTGDALRRLAELARAGVRNG
jgi:hypothetical protein